MIKIISTIAVLLITMVCKSQNFQGMAVYESKTNMSDMKSRIEGNKDITPEVQKMIEERMKRMSEKTFFLNFDKTISIYKEEEKLDTPGQGGGGGMMRSFMGGGGTHYKNIKEKSFVLDKEMMGKEFLIQDTIPKINWKLEQETKEIGGYLCFKATAKQKAQSSDFRNFRMKKKEEDEKKEKAEADKNKPTNFMQMGDMPKEIEIVAWYTPDIPISNGPENYYGLPGLILEVSAGKTTLLCSKIVLNIKDKKEIKAPTNGKVVTQTEYDDIVKKKMEEVMEMNSGRGGNGGMQIRMGR